MPGLDFLRALAIVAVMLCETSELFLRYVEAIYNPTWTRLDGLLAGVVLALVQGLRPVWWTWLLARGWMFLIVGAVGIHAASQLGLVSFAGAVFGFPLLSASLALLVLGAASPGTWLGRYAVPGAGPIAAMAFSLYLTHKHVFHLVDAHLGAWLEDSWLLAFGVQNASALCVAALLYLLVERPGLRLRERLLCNGVRSAGPDPAFVTAPPGVRRGAFRDTAA